ncbi:MAG: glycosyltransferase [Chthoniobacterales bacterium]
MKVCDLTQFYAPHSGGVKRYLHEKIRFLGQTEHEHVLIVPGRAATVSTESGSRVYTIAAPIVPRTGGYRVLLNLRAVGDILERERPDIIESADPYQLGWYAAHASRMLRIPAVAFYHSHFCEAYVVPAVERVARSLREPVTRTCSAYVRALYNRFAVTLTASKSLEATLLASGVRRVAAVGLGVDASIFRPRNDHPRMDAVRLLYVGRLNAEKNVRMLFDAFAELNRRGPNRFHLTVIGDGPERPHLEKLMRNFPNVTSLKYCADPAELAQHYRTADLFIHPGVRETFGLAAIEAQACGTPVVGIAGTRMDEAILHDQSWWAAENSAPALADGIGRATALDLAALGAATSQRVHERFGWKTVFERLLCIYRDVCTNYRRVPQ